MDEHVSPLLRPALREYAPLVGLPENYTIYDTSDSLQALKQAIDTLDLDLTHTTPDRVQSAISWAKNSLISPEQYEPRRGSPLGQIVAKVYPAYQKKLLESGAVDFDDLLLHVANLLRENPEIRRQLDQRYRYILVDEYQDTNLAQYTIVRAMSVDYPNLAVTGDPDQSIYGWRGANLNNILDFEHDYPSVKIVRLEQNYRSTKRILRVADRLISYNTRRKAKGLFTDNAEGKPVRLVFHPTQKDEAEQIAIVYRNRGSRRPPTAARFRSVLSHQRLVAVAGICAARVQRSVSNGQRTGVLSSQRNQRRAGIFAYAQQSARWRGVHSNHQYAAAGNWPGNNRAIARICEFSRYVAAGSCP